jgi:hypothetical protein
MPKKIAGNLAAPPPQGKFDRLPLARISHSVQGVYYRIHCSKPKSHKPWPAVHFSQRGTSRFDPVDGVGTLYLAETLGGAIMEKLDDQWGPVGSRGRRITPSQLATLWVSLVHLPATLVFDTGSAGLSKIGTDLSLLTGDYPIPRQWALRLMQHPDGIGGIAYVSRHDHSRNNIALFRRPTLLPAKPDASLTSEKRARWVRKGAHSTTLVHGPAVLLRDHPELTQSLIELEVARFP